MFAYQQKPNQIAVMVSLAFAVGFTSDRAELAAPASPVLAKNQPEAPRDKGGSAPRKLNRTDALEDVSSAALPARKVLRSTKPHEPTRNDSKENRISTIHQLRLSRLSEKDLRILSRCVYCGTEFD